MVATKHRRKQQTNNTKQHKGQGTNYILSINVSLPSFKIQRQNRPINNGKQNARKGAQKGPEMGPYKHLVTRTNERNAKRGRNK